MADPLTGLFLGAGASYEAGMPLVGELTDEIKSWLTGEKLRGLNLAWRQHGEGYSDSVIADLESVMCMKNMHYESILGHLETQAHRTENRHLLQEYSGLYSWLVDLVYQLLYFRQVNSDHFFDRQLDFYEGISVLASRNTPLWIFSLNHDLIVEAIAEKFSIPIRCGFSSEKILLPRRNAAGEKIGELHAEILTKKELEEGAMHFPNPASYGIHLLKIHGALDVFTFNDGNDLLKIIKDPAGPESVTKVLRAANEELLYSVPAETGEKVHVTNEIVFADSRGEMQFLRKSLLAGAYKFNEHRTQVLPKSMLKHFRQNLNFVSKLICIGYGFGDSHVNVAIADWLAFSTTRRLEIVSPQILEVPSFLLHLTPQIELVACGATDYLDGLAGIKRSRIDELDKKVAAAARKLGKRSAALIAQFFNEDLSKTRSAYLEKITSIPVADGKPDFASLGNIEEVAAAWTREIHETEEEKKARLLSFLNKELGTS